VTMDFGRDEIRFLPQMETKGAGEHSAPLAKRSVGYAVMRNGEGSRLN